VLDIQLKGMSGLELGRKLHAVKDTVPIIFINAQDSSELRAQAEALDGAVYFYKTDAGADILAPIRPMIHWPEKVPG
jgi:DNA-binding response OmpR family regulator